MNRLQWAIRRKGEKEEKKGKDRPVAQNLSLQDDAKVPAEVREMKRGERALDVCPIEGHHHPPQADECALARERGLRHCHAICIE